MIVIESCGYRAVVNPMGASLASVACEGRDLIMIQNGEYGSPFFRGAVLAPWPNRLEDGYYEFGGQAYSVPINEPGRFVALHGLALDREWVVISRGPDRVRLRLELGSDAGYPFDLSLEMTYSLTADGMKASLTATNNGESPAPYGCSFHPYFLPGEGLIDDVELRLGAHSWIELSADRLLPRGAGDRHSGRLRPSRIPANRQPPSGRDVWCRGARFEGNCTGPIRATGRVVGQNTAVGSGLHDARTRCRCH